MDPTDIGLFRLAEQRLAWVDRRQDVLARNVANANTPGYQAKDLSPFAGLLREGLSTTSPLHLHANGAVARQTAVKPADRGIAGNGVSVEQELGKVADTATAHELALNIYHEYQGMFRLVLGRGG